MANSIQRGSIGVAFSCQHTGGEPIEESSSALEIDLIGPTSIQVPVQAKRPGLVSIQKSIDEVPDIEQDFYHGFSAIIEETADNLEAIHRRRRSSQSRRSSNSYGEVDSQPLLFDERTEVMIPPTEELSFDQTVIEKPDVGFQESDDVAVEHNSVDAEPIQIAQPKKSNP